VFTEPANAEAVADAPAAAPAVAKQTKRPVLAAPAQDIEVIRDAARRDAFIQVFGKAYLDGFGDPILFREARFFSPAVQQEYKRNWALISRTLFGEYTYRRRPSYDQRVLDAFSHIVTTKLAAITELLNSRINTITKLCSDNGAQMDAAYMSCQTKQVPIIHAQAGQYLRALLLLDRFLQVSGSAALNGVIDGEQRRQAEMLCRKALYAFGAMIRNESIKVRKEAQRVLNDQRSKGQVDAEMQVAENMQGQALQEYDATGTDGTPAPAAAGNDSGTSASPAEEIDTIVAETKASDAATRKPRASKAAASA
jgi:hypothetical protein